MSGGGCSIVWFRRDLRVEDNPALAAGVRAGAVIAVFVWAPEEEGHYYPGRVSRWWLKQSLNHLDSSLKSLGTTLITKRSSDSVSSLIEIVKSTGATQLFFNHLYDPISLVRDHRAKELLADCGISVRSFNADLLYEPWEVNDDQGQPFTVFSDFWNRCLSMPYDPAAPMLPPKRIISGLSSTLLQKIYAFFVVQKILLLSSRLDLLKDLFQLDFIFKFDPNGEYVRRWLPELARLPTQWVHHPWNTPESVLQAAGVELGSNYPLPIVGLEAAKARLQEALSDMWQQEAAWRAAIENGTDEGLGESMESTPIAFPRDIQMEIDIEPTRNNNNNTTPMVRHQEDQRVPSMTYSFLRIEEEEESSVDLRNSPEETRAEVPTNMNMGMDTRTEEPNQGGVQVVRAVVNNARRFDNFGLQLQTADSSTAESSSSSRERDGGVVPVWSPSSSFSEQLVVEENGIGSGSSYLQRHPQSHQIINWRRLSQTGGRSWEMDNMVQPNAIG
ncbi:hypothetical protein C5167_028170 [Papaver somniferum]|nr:hypothetical protein C5167_028170 [Papaver somniferum]